MATSTIKTESKEWTTTLTKFMSTATGTSTIIEIPTWAVDIVLFIALRNYTYSHSHFFYRSIALTGEFSSDNERYVYGISTSAGNVKVQANAQTGTTREYQIVAMYR